MDDRHYLCECIVISTDYQRLPRLINKPSDNKHSCIYIVYQIEILYVNRKIIIGNLEHQTEELMKN